MASKKWRAAVELNHSTPYRLTADPSGLKPLGMTKMKALDAVLKASYTQKSNFPADCEVLF